MIAIHSRVGRRLKCGIVRNDTFATRASLSDLGALECPFGLLDFPFGRNGSYGGRVWIQQRAPRRLRLDASLGGHAALTLIAMTRGLRNRSRSLASVECRMKTVDKASALEVDRLVQEADGSAVQRACLNRLVAIGRYENDWYVKAEMRQMMLQL